MTLLSAIYTIERGAWILRVHAESVIVRRSDRLCIKNPDGREMIGEVIGFAHECFGPALPNDAIVLITKLPAKPMRGAEISVIRV
jgi:hypothetical protein